MQPLVIEPWQVSMQQAAAMLGYNKRTIQYLVQRGELSTVGCGRMRRIPIDELRGWQERNRNKKGVAVGMQHDV